MTSCSIPGVKRWLWRAVNQAGIVLDALVQCQRDKQAAQRLLRKLLKRLLRPPRVMITEGKGIAGTYTFEVAEQKQYEVLSMAKVEEHPLRVEVERV
jgi:putative transposase